MKVGGLAAPLLIATLSVATLGGLGTLAVQAGAVATRSSIDLLRMELRVMRLQEQLLAQGGRRLAAYQAAVLRPGGAPGAAGSASSAGLEASAVQPVPGTAAGAAGSTWRGVAPGRLGAGTPGRRGPGAGARRGAVESGERGVAEADRRHATDGRWGGAADSAWRGAVAGEPVRPWPADGSN